MYKMHVTMKHLTHSKASNLKKMMVVLISLSVLLSATASFGSTASDHLMVLRHHNVESSSSMRRHDLKIQIQLCQTHQDGEQPPHPSIPTCTASDDDSTSSPVILSINTDSLKNLLLNDGRDHPSGILLLDSINRWVQDSLAKNDWNDYVINNDNNKIHNDATATKIRITPHRYDRKLSEEFNEETSYTLYNVEINGALSLLCICFAALGAGLTMGMLSIEPLSLMIKMKCGSPKEFSEAKILLPIILKRHRLLVTLLILSSFANEALPLFLDKIVPSHVAILISVSAVLIFGEILPTTIFTGPNQVSMAAAMTPFVKVLMILLCPIAWPVARVLDRYMQHDDHSISKAYAREEISALVRIMYEEQKREKQDLLNSLLQAGSVGAGDAGSFIEPRTITKLDHVTSNVLPADEMEITRPASFAFDEVAMVEGALQMRTRTAKDIYTPLSKVYAIEKDTILDENTIAMIYSSGHSRIPVYQQRYNNSEEVNDITSITAILLTRQLMVVDSDDKRRVSTLPLFEPICVGPDVSLLDLLHVFRGHHDDAHMQSKNSGRASHLAVVCIHPDLANQSLDKALPIPEEACVLGIVTLEDVIEQLVQESIVDEYDTHEVKAKRRAKHAFQKWKVYAKKTKFSSSPANSNNASGVELKRTNEPLL